MFKIGLSSCGFELTQKNFEDLAKSGIEAVEISMKADKYPAIDYAAVKRFADAAGVKLWSYHLPFSPFTLLDPADRDKEVRKSLIDLQTGLLNAAGDAVNADHLILDVIDKANGLDLFAEIGDHLHISGRKLKGNGKHQHLRHRIALLHSGLELLEDNPLVCRVLVDQQQLILTSKQNISIPDLTDDAVVRGLDLVLDGYLFFGCVGRGLLLRIDGNRNRLLLNGIFRRNLNVILIVVIRHRHIALEARLDIASQHLVRGQRRNGYLL